MAMTLTQIRADRETRPQPVPDDLRALPAEPGTLLWIDVTEPSELELTALQKQLDLPPLAVEDARESNQRPKLHEYAACALVVAYGATTKTTPIGPRLALNEVTLFIGQSYIVSVRQKPVLSTEELRERLTMTARRTPPSSTALAYTVLDLIVDGYYGVADTIESAIEDLDAKVWAGLSEQDLGLAFALRRDLVRFRRVVAPLREVLNVMIRREGSVLDDTVDEYLRDLYDHVVTVYEEIETNRELLAGTLDGHLSMVSNRMNGVVLKVSAWAAIIAVPTVIASIYGMNFDHMPELHWLLGYPLALLLMLGAALGLFTAFKHRDWL